MKHTQTHTHRVGEISIYRTGWPWTNRDPPASNSQMMRLKLELPCQAKGFPDYILLKHDFCILSSNSRQSHKRVGTAIWSMNKQMTYNYWSRNDKICYENVLRKKAKNLHEVNMLIWMYCTLPKNRQLFMHLSKH